MKKYIAIACVLVGLYIQAQSNIFLGRDFWKTQPTIEQVKEKIKEGNSPTEFNKWSFDATVYAIISHAPTESIKYLTTLKGNEIDKNTHDGRNYLLWAAYAGDYDLVDYLIQKGSDVKWIDDHGFDIVTFTAVGGNTNPKLYELYKKHGFNLKESKRKGANALLIAAPSVKDISELDYFIQNGMSWKDRDENGNNVFLSAVSKGNIELLKQLQEKTDFKAVNKNHENAILKAAQGARRHENTLETFQFLTELGLNPLQENDKGENVLHYLAKSNPNWDVFEFFMDKGADINAVDKNGNTPYLNAVKYENKNMEKIAQLNKNFHQINKEGYAALSYAVANLDKNTVAFLLNQKVATDVLTAEKESLLNVLFKNFNPKKEKEFNSILEILAEQKIQPTINSETGNSLFHIAVNQNASTLLAKAKKISVDIDKMNAEGLTPLHLAAMKAKDLDMLKTLVDLGANTRIHTEFGEDAKVLALENELLQIEAKDLEFLNK